jgi:putative transposase
MYPLIYSVSALEGESLEWMRLRSTTKYWCGYHFVWIPKYRRDILVGEVLSEILRELGCEPLALDVMPDHALCPPRHSPAYIVNYLKGKSARILQSFPELKTAIHGKLWSRSYYVEEQWRRRNEEDKRCEAHS